TCRSGCLHEGRRKGLVLEEQRCEFMQAAPPGLPLVSRLRRHVEDAVDASLFERLGVRLGVASEASAPAASAVGGVKFAAAVADEHDLDLLLEGGQIGDVRQGDAAAAEEADMGELVEVGQGDHSG